MTLGQEEEITKGRAASLLRNFSVYLQNRIHIQRGYVLKEADIILIRLHQQNTSAQYHTQLDHNCNVRRSLHVNQKYQPVIKILISDYIHPCFFDFSWFSVAECRICVLPSIGLMHCFVHLLFLHGKIFKAGGRDAKKSILGRGFKSRNTG